jgi:hypothetical protein
MSAALAELRDAVDALAAEAVFERGLAAVAAELDPGALTDFAAWALEKARALGLDQRYGVLLMLAAAATAKASGAGAIAPVDERTLLARLNAIQAAIIDGQQPPAALAAFAPLGNVLLFGDCDPFLDMKVDTTHDDTVFFFASGVLALRRHLRPPPIGS